MKYLIVLLIGLSMTSAWAEPNLCEMGLGGQDPFPQWLVKACSSGASPVVGRPTLNCQFKGNANMSLVLSRFKLQSFEFPLITHLLQIFAGGVLVESHPVSESLGILDTFYIGANAHLTLRLEETGVVRFSGTSAELDCERVF